MEEPAPRMFWPREVWGRYGRSLDAFKKPANRAAAVRCLNHLVGCAPWLQQALTCSTLLADFTVAPCLLCMQRVASRPEPTSPCNSALTPHPRPSLQVTDALRHLPYSLDYMSKLQDTEIFRFCAIPQVMAAGTLALCYNNGAIFEGERGAGGRRCSAGQPASFCSTAPACLSAGPCSKQVLQLTDRC